MKDREKDGHQMHEEIHSIHPKENTKTIKKYTLVLNIESPMNIAYCTLDIFYLLSHLFCIKLSDVQARNRNFGAKYEDTASRYRPLPWPIMHCKDVHISHNHILYLEPDREC